MKIDGEQYLFFLRLTSELPEVYFHLAQNFKSHHIRLIPVSVDDLREIQGRQKIDLLVLTPDFQSWKNFLNSREKFIDYGMNTRSIRLFELTSFRKNMGYYRQEKKEMYFSFQLPIEINEVVHAIGEALKKEIQPTQVWPGGRRSKLPTL